MKARSVVFAHIQNPDTIFGLPPKMVLLTMCAGVIVMVSLFMLAIFVMQGLMALALVGFAVTVAGGLTLAYRAGRNDRHVEHLYQTSARFWRSFPRRWLLAGAAPVSSPRGGRS